MSVGLNGIGFARSGALTTVGFGRNGDPVVLLRLQRCKAAAALVNDSSNPGGTAAARWPRMVGPVAAVCRHLSKVID